MTKRPKSQKQRFIEAAREHGASEDRDAFERAFAKVVPTKSGKPSPKAKKPAGG